MMTQPILNRDHYLFSRSRDRLTGNSKSASVETK
jgi:hypothetical protein